MSHGILNKRPMVRFVVKAHGGTSSSPGTLALFPLNTTLGGIVVIFIPWVITLNDQWNFSSTPWYIIWTM
jgi:hypothetical protein